MKNEELLNNNPAWKKHVKEQISQNVIQGKNWIHDKTTASKKELSYYHAKLH